MRDSFLRNTISSLSALALLGFMLVTTSLVAQPAGQWDFTNDLTATVGADLQYADGVGGATQTGTSFGTTTSFGIPDINGVVANVMKFPAALNGMGYYMTAPATPNGGGTLVNDYTIIYDLLYPQGSLSQLRPLIDTDGGNFVPEADAVIDASNGVGITPNGPYGGIIASNTWYRVGIVVQQEQNTVTCYINGARVSSATLSGSQSGLDGRFALSPNALVLILATPLTNAAPGYVNSIQLRTAALNAGQMKSLGGPSAAGIPQTLPPVPSFVDTRSPDVNSTSEPPSPNIHVALMAGDTTIDGNSIKLYLDGTLLPATVTPAAPNYTIDYAVTNFLRPLSAHEVDLVYSDSVVGLQTNSWSFSVMNYQNVTLPAPFYLETFDELAQGTLPAGWVVTNRTQADIAGFDLSVPKSDAYLDWVVVSTNTIASITSWDSARRLTLPPIVLNGVLLDSLAHTNFAYAESDQRNGSQVQVMFTAQLDCTGHTNVYAAWHNIQEQNQDDIEAVEYSADGGTNWHPIVYFLPDSDGTDFSAGVVVTNNGQVDAIATLASTAHGPAWGLPYGTWIAAPITTNLAPYIVPQPDDEANITIESGVAHEAWIGKNIQVHRLPLADNSAHVMLRFMQAGTGSWYFGIDDLGLYSINTPVVTGQPASQTVDAGTSATFTVVAGGAGTLQYQWEFNGNPITGATNSTYTISSAQTSNGGLYDVVVSNSDGPTTSSGAKLTVVTTPQILSSPYPQTAYLNDSATFIATARGGQPLSYQWYLGTTAVSGATSNVLTLHGLSANDAGDYMLVVSNSFGTASTTPAHLAVVSGSITNGLVAHLKFDGNYSDSSGTGTDGAAVGSPTFDAGILGQAVHINVAPDSASVNNYVTLGYPDALKFGDSTDFSISMWIKINSSVADEPFMANKDWDSGGNIGWVISNESDGVRLNWRDTANGRKDMSGHAVPALEDKNWHNLVVTFQRNGLASTYLDGVLDTTHLMYIGPDAGKALGSIDTDNQGKAVNIGEDGTGAYNVHDSAGLDCLVDDVGIWRRVLAPTEAASIFLQGQKGQDFTTASGAPVVLPATIAADPFGQVVSPGANVTLSVTPGGTPPFTYSWLKDGSPVGSATTSNLTLNAVSAADAGLYAAVVGNAGGSVTSRVAQLVVFSGSITQSLVAHLKFDGDYKDASGTATDGAAVGSPDFQAGILGQAVHVNSAGTPQDNPSPNNYVTLGTAQTLKFTTNDFSVAFWTKIASQNDDKPFISNKDWGSGSNPGWAIATEGDGTKWNFRDDQSARRDSQHAGPQLLDKNWHHVVVSFQRSSAGRIYVDGQLVETSNLAPDNGKVIGSADTTNSVNIGQDGTGHYTDGDSAAAVDMLVDDLGLWSRALTPSEAGAIFAAGQAGKDLSQAVVVATPTQPTLSVTVSGGSLHLTWPASATGRLQTTTSLAPVGWADVPGTIGLGTATVPISGASAFFRVAQ